MLNLIYQKAKTDKKVIPDCRPFFSVKKKEEWFHDPVVQFIMKHVDNTELIDGMCLRNELGQTIPPEYLSTGCKVTILIWEYPDIVFNLTQCGDNAFACVVDMCRVSDRTLLTYRYISTYLFREIKLQKDGKDITLEEYEDNVDEWLEEIMND